MNSSIYFNSLFSKEFQLIGSVLFPSVTVELKNILDDSRFHVKRNDDIYIIVTLFHVKFMKSSNINDRVNENSIICEKNNDTVLYFNNYGSEEDIA